ncbi:MAG: hypothetical protein IPK71_25775 [Myxococcales bacterium]|jgi:hypothetical protein|nr:hypothetical protein [Myxococcales bacterium]
MRGFLSPALRKTQTEPQIRFSGLARGRRVKLAASAKTTLVKADQWARGEEVDTQVAEALLTALSSLKAKK